ncbi:fluoride efflux transporter CrcB [Spirosoma sp. KNUC1025]|uniref:fluoride efflux transporter CrcB n=1 Tax=Spirosoma sp. KNUC1025 TaxID=2894082 RepID=UPI0038648D43|nr:fluoride efflux transporter CrcB [Spirosoma sp. KNUC1025]
MAFFCKFVGMRALFMHPYVLVFVGGGIGSLTRYMAGRLIPATLLGTPFPNAILIVNVLASFVLGLVVGWVISRSAGEEVRLFIGVGFCGGLSTFSSFSYDTAALLQNGRFGVALLNIVLNVVLCLLASFGGLWLSQKL